MKQQMRLNKKSTLVFVLALILLLGAGMGAYVLRSSKNTSSLNAPIVTGISKHACTSQKKCFDLQGKAYIASEQDSENVLDVLADTVKQKHLTDNSEFHLIDGKAMSNKDKAIEAGSADENTYGRFLISLSYSGGIFGEYNFPYSNDGHALYASAFTADDKHSDSDLIYVLKSEFGTNDYQSQLLLTKAKSLHKDQYILMIAEN